MLHALTLCAGVIIAVPLHEVDDTPDTETSAERDNESLQYTDCAAEKCHKVIPPLIFPENKKRAPISIPAGKEMSAHNVSDVKLILPP